MVSTIKGQSLYQRARTVIPGGTQLLSKRPEMFLPNGWPSYYATAKGITVTDLDGNNFRDFSIGGVGATVLGYADPHVDNAVKRAIDCGSMSTLNSPEEVALAERLVTLHPWADMVRFARAGGEAMAVAVRIARAYTGRATIAFCGYHGWHDWYLSANLAEDGALDGHLMPGLNTKGVPRSLKGLMQPFHYNNLAELQKIAAQHGRGLAAIVMEPVRDVCPEPGFLSGVRQIADETGAILLFDEVTSGFRINTGGVHLNYGIKPDMAVFAKALGNGYPIAAVIGRDDVMQAAQDSFISSTSWTERTGPAAALAMIEKHERDEVPARLVKTGKLVKSVWKDAADHAGLDIHISGMDPLAHIVFQGSNKEAQRTLFTQEMLDRGFLAGSAFYAMAAHTDSDITDYGDACREVFALISKANSTNSVKGQLRGPVAHTGFKRLT